MIMVSTDMWLCVVSYKFNAVLKENLLPLSWYLIMDGGSKSHEMSVHFCQTTKSHLTTQQSSIQH